jgi:DNA-binding transcriptional regulator YiaG
MNPFTSARHTTPNVSETTTGSPPARPRPLPWQMGDETEAVSQTEQQEDDPRLVAMERYEYKRRLVRDAKALSKLRKITQRQMAEEIGVPRRTLEEWLQFRRMPQAPSEALLRLWLSRQTSFFKPDEG